MPPAGGTLAVMDEPVLPQQPIEANAEVLSVEWLFEPLWPGLRMMARADRGRIDLTDELGEPIPDEGDTADATEILADAILADEALVDGVWTAQPFVGDGSPARAWAETLAAEGLMGMAEVVCDLGTDRFGVCAAARCTNVFVDTSPNRSRRYCSERCSSRANVAAFRARRKAHAAAASS
jgi:hypothetical protein